MHYFGVFLRLFLSQLFCYISAENQCGESAFDTPVTMKSLRLILEEFRSSLTEDIDEAIKHSEKRSLRNIEEAIKHSETSLRTTIESSIKSSEAEIKRFFHGYNAGTVDAISNIYIFSNL
jgi:hypothetical protein